MILLQIIFDFRRQQLRKVADHTVRADQIRGFTLFHLFILHSDQLAHLLLRLPDQNFIIKQHKRRVNSHTNCDIHNLKHHSGPRTGRHIPADQSRRRPFHALHAQRHPAQPHRQRRGKQTDQRRQ